MVRPSKTANGWSPQKRMENPGRLQSSWFGREECRPTYYNYTSPEAVRGKLSHARKVSPGEAWHLNTSYRLGHDGEILHYSPWAQEVIVPNPCPQQLRSLSAPQHGPAQRQVPHREASQVLERRGGHTGCFQGYPAQWTCCQIADFNAPCAVANQGLSQECTNPPTSNSVVGEGGWAGIRELAVRLGGGTGTTRHTLCELTHGREGHSECSQGCFPNRTTNLSTSRNCGLQFKRGVGVSSGEARRDPTEQIVHTNLDDINLLQPVQPDRLEFRSCGRGLSRMAPLPPTTRPSPAIMMGYNTIPLPEFRFKPGVALKLPRMACMPALPFQRR